MANLLNLVNRSALLHFCNIYIYMCVCVCVYIYIYILCIYFSSILHPWQVVACSASRLFVLNEFNRGSVSASASARTTSYKQPMTREWKIAADWQWGLPDCHRRWSRCKGFVSSRWCRAFFGVIPVVQCRVCAFCFLLQSWTCFFSFSGLRSLASVFYVQAHWWFCSPNCCAPHHQQPYAALRPTGQHRTSFQHTQVILHLLLRMTCLRCNAEIS